MQGGAAKREHEKAEWEMAKDPREEGNRKDSCRTGNGDNGGRGMRNKKRGMANAK